MTQQVIVGGVDLTTGHNVSVSQTINNPLIVISSTMLGTATPTESSQIAVNLGLLSIRYTVTFDLIDGIATNLYGSTSGNSHNKLRALCSASPDAFTFTWGSASVQVLMESLTISSKPGYIDATGAGLTSGTCVLVETKKL